MGLIQAIKNLVNPDRLTEQARVQMIQTYSPNYLSFSGNLYDSDIVRACIRPVVQSLGKMEPKHLKAGRDGNVKINPVPWIRILLRRPNPYMSGQLFIEKMATQLMLNNNAFALVIRSDVGTVQQLYPITKIRLVEQLIDKDGSIYLRFTCANSKVFTFAYEDILHLRRDYYSEEILGDAPGKALTQLLDTVGTVDQGIVNAVKNSGVIRWLLKFNQSLRPEDLNQISEAVTDCLFSVREQEAGNKIIYEASNLMYASLSTKLAFVQFVDRGIMCANEVRKILNLAPIPGGDEYVRRLDTAPIETKQDKKYVKIVEE